MRSRSGLMARVFVCGILALGKITHAEMKVTQTVVGPATSDVVYVVSPAGGHVAAGKMSGSRFVVALDGVDGPKVDSVMMVLPAAGVVSPGDPKSALPGYMAKPINQTPVVFSEDGKQYAYLARVGQEYLVIVDGKEQRRFPVASGQQIRMQFTGPDAKHFVMTISNPTGVFDVWVDGEQKPPHDPNTVMIFNRDGSRYAYVALPDAANRQKRVTVVDGKEVGVAIDDPRFTANGKHVITLAQSDKGQAVLVDGVPAVTAMSIQRVYLAPAGDKFVTVISKPAQGGTHYVCVADGKEIAATEGTDFPFVAFSPNGQRWAARCRTMQGAAVTWLATDDGKKSQEYNGIDDASITFSPDGSRLAYVAGSGSKSFAIIDGKESEGFNYNLKVGFSPDGKQAYYGGRQDGATVTRSLVIEGKVYKGDHNFNNESITFSPDGSRWGALGSGLKAGGPTGLQTVENFLLDGKLVEGFTVSNFLFANNGSHVVYLAQRKVDNASGLFLDDGKTLGLGVGTRGRPPIFSPDGNHLFWSKLQQDPANNNKPTHFIYADGKEIAKFDNVSLGNFETDPAAWRTEPDGTLIAVGAVGEQVICYRVTPGDDTSVAKAADELAAAEAKAKTDAEAAKQAAADAAAKKKADAEAAAKAKQEAAAKARQDAIDAKKAAAAAKKKAAEDAAAAKKAKQPGK